MFFIHAPKRSDGWGWFYIKATAGCAHIGIAAGHHHKIGVGGDDGAGNVFTVIPTASTITVNIAHNRSGTDDGYVYVFK